jgi:L-fuculose-phosphate aldolase
MSDALRDEVALGCRILALEDQGDFVWGHVSARDPDGRGVWMKAATWGFEEIGREQVILVSWDGDVIGGEGRRHIEYPIHTELMRARPDVNCVVHTHAPWSVAFASLEEPLRPISHEGALFVPPDVPRFTTTGSLIVDAGLGAALAATVGATNAALIPHHGIVTCGTDAVTGVMSAVLLERACRHNMRALAAGGPKTWSSDEEALEKRELCWPPALLRQAWDYLARRLEG